MAPKYNSLLRSFQNAFLPPIGPPLAGFGRYFGVRKLAPRAPFWSTPGPWGAKKKTRKTPETFWKHQNLKHWSQLYKPEGTRKTHLKHGRALNTNIRHRSGRRGADSGDTPRPKSCALLLHVGQLWAPGSGRKSTGAWDIHHRRPESLGIPGVSRWR